MYPSYVKKVLLDILFICGFHFYNPSSKLITVNNSRVYTEKHLPIYCNPCLSKSIIYSANKKNDRQRMRFCNISVVSLYSKQLGYVCFLSEVTVVSKTNINQYKCWSTGWTVFAATAGYKLKQWVDKNKLGCPNLFFLRLDQCCKNTIGKTPCVSNTNRYF